MNKKGFTLIELLAVIVIIALIIIIVAPNVTKVITGAKSDTQDVQFANVERAIQTYITQNSLTLGDTATVCISDLKKAGLLENKKIVNPDTDEEYTGCFTLNWNDEYNQYDYTYAGGGAGHKVYPVYPDDGGDDTPGGGDTPGGDDYYPDSDGNSNLCMVGNGSTTPLSEYGFLASESDIAYNLWNYRILDSSAKTAVITGVNFNCLLFDADPSSDFKEAVSLAYDIDTYLDIYAYGGSYYNSDFNYIRKIVIPSKVKLNSNGQYDSNGQEYTIKQAYFDSSSEKFKQFNGNIESIIFPNSVEKVFDLNGGYPSLSTYRLPNNLKYMPKISGIDSGLEINVPSSITSIPSAVFNVAGDFNKDGSPTMGHFSVILPSTITSIGQLKYENLVLYWDSSRQPADFQEYISTLYNGFSVGSYDEDVGLLIVKSFKDIFEHYHGANTFNKCFESYTDSGSYSDESLPDYCHDLDYIHWNCNEW